jgi:O-antigen/teichoic acid export membrane protein
MFVTVQAFGTLTGLLIARSLGPSGRGSITILVVWAQLLGWTSSFSLDKGIVVLSRSEATSHRIDPDDGVAWARRFVLLLSLPVAAASLAIGAILYHKWDWAALLAIGAVATAFGELGAGWLLAKKRIAHYILYRLAQPTLYILGCGSVAYGFRKSTYSLRLDAMAIAVLVSLVAPVLVVSIITYKRGRHEAVGGALIRFAASAQVANAMQYLNSRLDIVALSLFSTSREVGIYSVGLGIGQATVLLGSAGIVRGITGSARKLDKAGIIGTILLGLVICLLSPFVIPLIFGSTFDQSIRVAQIIALGGSINYALQSSSGRLLGAGRPWLMALAEGCGGITFAIGIAISRNLQVVAYSDVASYLVSFLLAHLFLSRVRGGIPFTGDLPVIPE